jgi:carbon monoxide dehydrogenase subunit G
MKLEQSFEVSAPIDRVWKAQVDVEHVAPCLPGAAVTGRNDDGSYNGTFSIKIGPTTAAYAGKLEMKEIDEQAHEATMHAQGNDKRGQGGANATIVSKVVEEKPGETRVDVATDYHITGRLARFGRGGMIEDISERLLREFAQRLQASLTDEPAKGPDEAPEPEAAAEPAAPAPDAKPEEPEPKPEEPEPKAEEPEPKAEEPEPKAEEPEPKPEEPEPKAEAPEPAEPILPEPEPLAAPPPPPAQETEPLDAGSLVGSVMAERVKRNPGPLVLLLGVVVALIALRRKRS